MNRTPDRSDRYEEDPYFREERDDPNEMDREESLNDCLLEIARLANDARELTREPREFTIFPIFTGDPSVPYGAVEKYDPHWAGGIKVREVL